MASSSRAVAGKRRKGNQSSEGDSSFYSASECRIREHGFRNRSFGVLSWISSDFLIRKGFRFIELLREQKLVQFLEFNHNFYPSLVQQFYANLRCVDDSYETVVAGTHIEFTPNLLHTLFDLSFRGENSLKADADLIFLNLIRPGQHWTQGHKKASCMTVQNRVLHYIISHQVIPQTSANYAYVTNDELRLLDALLDHNLLNWSAVILNKMIQASSSKSSAWLPYPMHIARILEHFRIPIPSDEQPVTPMSHTNLLGDKVLKQLKMKFVAARGEYIWLSDEAGVGAAAQMADQRGLDADQLEEEEAAYQAAADGPPVEEGIRFSPDYSTRADFQSFQNHIDARLDILEGRMDTHQAQIASLGHQMSDNSAHFDQQLNAQSQHLTAHFDAQFARLMDAFGRFQPPSDDPPPPMY